MTLIAYKEQRFAAKTLRVINKAREILDEYATQGYKLTLRQLYYQFITLNYFENSEKSYDRLGEAISNARLAGLISWDAIEDRTRNIRKRDQWENPTDFHRDAKKWFHHDMWANQDNYVEVWVEKDALLGVIERPCWDLDTPFMSCRGYMSQSEEWEAANRFEEAVYNGKTPYLLYLGDHDPSGVDMTRDHRDRLTMFLERHGVEVEVRRLALNIDQVQQYKPPPNPTKPKDSRSPDYIKKFGRTCWELDALRPKVIDDLIRVAVDDLRDMERWAERENQFKEKYRVLTEQIELGITAYTDKVARDEAAAELRTRIERGEFD